MFAALWASILVAGALILMMTLCLCLVVLGLDPETILITCSVAPLGFIWWAVFKHLREIDRQVRDEYTQNERTRP